MKTSSYLAKLGFGLLIGAAVALPACQASAGPATQIPLFAPTSASGAGTAQAGPTALVPATLGPTPTQFQPELTSQALTAQPGGVAPFGIKQMAGALAVVPNHYQWTSQIGDTQATEGSVYFSILLSLENTSATDSINISPAQFALLDAQGNVLPANNTNADTPVINPQTLSPGQQVQGSVFYEVPESAQAETGWNLILVFTGADQTTLKWSISS